MAKIQQEATRLTRLVDDLLLLARLDEGRPLAAQPMLIFRRVVTDLAGASYMALSLGALYLSINGGMFGFNETLNAPWVKFSLLDETIGLAACSAAAAIALGPSRRQAE